MRTLQPYLINGPRREGTALLINRVRADGKDSPSKEATTMARKKLYGAAAKAHAKKQAKSKRRSNPARKASRPARRKKRHQNRKRHVVKDYKRKGGAVSAYRRKGAFVKKHWSNRKRRRSNPFGVGQAGSVAMEGLIGAGVVLGTLLVVGLANGQLQKWGPTQSGWGNLAGKLALAVAGGMAAQYAYRKGTISKQTAFAITGTAMAPLLLGSLAMFAPQVAGRINLAGDGDSEGHSGDGSEGMGDVVEHGAVAAQLEAELQAQLEAELNDGESEASGI